MIAVAAACGGSGLPDPSSPAYEETVAAFYRGVAAAQAGETGIAGAAFQRVTELAPLEPAGWANLGLVALQRRELEEASRVLTEATRIAPEHSQVRLLAALVAREAGRPDEAVEDLRHAVRLDPRNLKAQFLLAQSLEEQDDPESAAEARQHLDDMLAIAPDNLPVLLERARLAAKLSDTETLRQTLARVRSRVDSFSVPLSGEIEAVQSAGEAGNLADAATQVAFLQTELQVVPAYRDDEDAVLTSPTRIELLFTRFARLSTTAARVAPLDTGLRFVPESLSIGAGPVAWVRALWLSDDVPLALVAANRDTVWVSTEPNRAEAFPFPGGAGGDPPPSSVAALDFDYDFRTDLALAGAGGLRLLRQDEAGSFSDVTAAAVPPTAARTAYASAWALDLDMEGDLDLILGALAGPPVLLRNRGDGTFETYGGFPGVSELRDAVWADLDADGDPDAALLDASGRLHVFLNQRSGSRPFLELSLPETLGGVRAIAAADQNRDATIDLILLRADGGLSRLSLHDGAWSEQALVESPELGTTAATQQHLIIADFDSNGDLDLVVSTRDSARVWLAAPSGFVALPTIAGAWVTGLADISGVGRLDLLGASNGEPRLFVNRGTMAYYSVSIRPRAADAAGDRRINTFGVGGEIEIRAGLLYQKQVINTPVVHFGLGEHTYVDVARIAWPNGTVQAEFNLPATNETILTRQRLKGSCPWVFTFDGDRMQFVTDFLWRTALGLRINAQGDALVIHSEDWIKIRGDQLVPRDGSYDVRITAELWETHFFDHVALLAVDHPEGTEVFVDERFILPPPAQAVQVIEPRRPVRSARDDAGRDVTELIRARDGRFLDTFDVGPYQGIAAEHYVEVELGDDVPPDQPVWLVATGWVYPTDASINVAVSQGSHPTPRGVQLEVPNLDGGWDVREADLGFPAGKMKTMLIDLQDAFRPGADRRVRLRTNMEIYWDEIAWAVARPEAPTVTRRLLPDVAELRYRGFSEVTHARRSSPETPEYARIAGTAPLWRDLVGFHTRFGDVRELTEAVDDRYVIMNAGDELLLRFPALPPTRNGWTRDFVLIGDGWVKDGDYNTGFSTTVRPLPYHGMRSYDTPPGRLEDDPAYRRHPGDWKTYHTRYVTPRAFHRALLPDRAY